MRLAGRCCSTRPTVLLTTSALATVLAAALMRRRPPATDEMACTRVKSGPIFAGGGETFSVVVDNPPAEHWEGALASPALAVSLDDPAVLVASNDRCHSPDTQVHRSQDGGRSWAQVAEMKNQYWSSLFFHRWGQPRNGLACTPHPSPHPLGLWVRAVPTEHGRVYR